MGETYWILVWDGYGAGLNMLNPRLHAEGFDMYGNPRNSWDIGDGLDDEQILARHGLRDAPHVRVMRSCAESESAALRAELASVREAVDGACQYMLGHTYRTADDGKALVQACVDVRSKFAEALQVCAHGDCGRKALIDKLASAKRAQDILIARFDGAKADIDATMRDYQIEGDESCHDICARLTAAAVRMWEKLASAKAERDEATRDFDALRVREERVSCEVGKLRAERNRALRDLASARAVVEAAKEYVAWFGGPSHHRDDCPSRLNCESCRVCDRFDAALAALDRAQPANPAPGGESASPRGDIAECERAVTRDPQAPATLADLELLARQHVERIARRVVREAVAEGRKNLMPEKRSMTVGELRERLAGVDDEMPVVVEVFADEERQD